MTSPYKLGANLHKEFICFQQVTLKSRRVAKYEYIKENEPEESVHEVTREENCIDVETESELPDLDHLVSIHLLFSPSSQIKTVGRNCETKVVDFRAECTYCIKTLNWDQVFKDVTYDFNFHFIAYLYGNLYDISQHVKYMKTVKFPVNN